MTQKRMLLAITAAVLIAVISVTAAYLADMKREYERVASRGTVIPSPYGDIEYIVGGSGPAVLVIHGSGGGYDQGELVAQAVLGGNFRWIAPSRFGYLRSTFREGATWDDQAHAYAHLLDHLRFLELMGASDAVVSRLTPQQRASLERVIDYMNPVALRSAGVTFDNEAALPGERIAAIRAPTLIFHAIDDSLQLFHNAQFAATTILSARLVSFERGGHVVMIVEQSTIRAAARQHILSHVRE